MYTAAANSEKLAIKLIADIPIKQKINIERGLA
jgi:hypothetical protein